MQNITPVKREIEWGGKTLSVEIGQMAQQTNASALVRYGDTVVLATVVASTSVREGIDYFPLMVEFEERFYAAGKVKGSRFIKREGRPTDAAVLTGRMVDRAIRPLFDDRMRNEVQIVFTVLSFDGENDPDVICLVAAPLVLTISNIPWDGPLAGVRVGRIDGEYVINPTYEQRANSNLDLVLGGTSDRLLMLDAEGHEYPDAQFAEAIEYGQQALQPVLDLIESLRVEIGQEKINLNASAVVEEEHKLEDEIHAKIREWSLKQLQERFFNTPHASKIGRKLILSDIKRDLEEWLIGEQVGKEKRKVAMDLFENIATGEVTRAIVENEQRVDGRSLTDIRTLVAQVNLLPRTHGSALFSRGETQVLSVVTLASPSSEQIIDSMEEDTKKRYMHHYNFPPFSVGEAGRIGATGRREIGHGALAEKAIEPVLPDKTEYPYTIRVVSEVLGSNGSSSMASTCGSSLALLDAGVPLKRPVAGIAMGLASDGDGKYKILIDLQDLEDGKGGMDFKVAGTSEGITAVQLDTKTKGLTPEIVRETVQQAKEARLQVLEVMNNAISVPSEMSEFAPRIETLHINPDKIRDLIGPGGKVINEIIDATGVSIDVEQDGTVMVCGPDAKKLADAVERVTMITKEVEVGEIYTGKVVRIVDFGAFVEILPKKDGLVHISELAPYRVNKVEDIVKMDQEVKVKVIEIDDLGRVNLSLKQANPPEYFPPAPAMGSDDHPRQQGKPKFNSHRSK
jgi:polyribonucleotide nucleotidyltransferase